MNYSSLRLDRFLTLYFFYPLMRILPRRKELRIPILMYHSISKDIKHSIHPYYQTSTSPQVFAEHMKFLYENNYTVISLVDAVKMFTSQNIFFNKNSSNQPNLSSEIHGNDSEANLTGINKSTNPQTNYVVLTFDDGFRDFYMEAFPVLQNYDFSVTMFLPTGLIDNKRKRFKSKECLKWQEVLDLHKKGVIIGSHTVNHPKLHMLRKDEIEFELKHSKKQIEDKIGDSIGCFSYPFAFPEEDKEFIKSLRSILENCGYKYVVSTMIGTTTMKNASFFLKRIPVNSFDDPRFFQSKLEGAYNWLYKFQGLFKFIKRQLRQRSHANDN